MRPQAFHSTRRQFLVTGTGLAASVMVRPADATTEELSAALRTYAAGAPVQAGRVKLDIAPLIDNGNSVPITIQVDSPMSQVEHVTSIVVFNEKNPQRDVVKFTLGPRAGLATVSTRIRLATTQKLVAVARMSDGSYWSDTVEVIVSIAACLENPI